MRIAKVFNNNVVLGVDDAGREVVLIGRGLGFGAKTGDDVDHTRVERTFAASEGQPPERIAAYLDAIPMEDIELTEEIIRLGRAAFGDYIGGHMLFALADHLSFALRRASEGITIAYPLQWEVAALYPQEVGFARSILALVEERTGVRLPDLEAIPFVLHFVNARFGHDDLSATMEMTEVFGSVLGVVRDRFGIAADESSLDVTRFITHLRYLFLRQQKGAVSGGDQHQLFDLVKASQPREYACAVGVKDMLEERFGWDLNENEVLYLTLHVARLTASAGVAGTPARG